MSAKPCPGCKRTLPPADFGSDVTKADGLNTRCKACKRTARGTVGPRPTPQPKPHRPAAPLRDWHRRHPTASTIAARLLQDPAILNLRTSRLATDIMATCVVSDSTARVAIAIARRMHPEAAW